MKVTIRFEGICTFFNNYSSLVEQVNEPPIHRMVLVNANIREIAGHEIDPHVARMTVLGDFEWTDNGFPPGAESGVIDLNREDKAYLVSVRDPVTSQRWINNTCCLPHLTAAIPPEQVLGAPDFEVIANFGAACYVDFTYGRIDGYAVRASGVGYDPTKLKAISIATVETEGTSALLDLTWAETVYTLKLYDGATVTIANAPDPGSRDNDQYDFLLNFLTLSGGPPPDVIVPESISCTPLEGWLDGPTDAGPGCSNTTYP